MFKLINPLTLISWKIVNRVNLLINPFELKLKTVIKSMNQESYSVICEIIRRIKLENSVFRTEGIF